MNGLPAFSAPSQIQQPHHNNNHHHHHQHDNHHHPHKQEISLPNMHVTITTSDNHHNGGNTHNTYYESKLPMMVKRSQKVGRDNHNNSFYFDHFEQSVLKQEFHTPEVDKITVFHTHNVVVGIECHYKTLGKDNVATLTNKGSHHGHIQSSSIHLEFGESFTEVSGRAGDSIDRLCIKTNKGKVLDVGGNGGQPFQNLLPWGFPHIVSFGGSTREYLDSLYVLHK